MGFGGWGLGLRVLGSGVGVQRFRGGLVFKAHRLCVSLSSRLEGSGLWVDRTILRGVVLRVVNPVHLEQHRKVDVRLPGKGSSNSHGARPVHLIITMIKRIRTSRLSIKNSLSPPVKHILPAAAEREGGDLNCCKDRCLQRF